MYQGCASWQGRYVAIVLVSKVRRFVTIGWPHRSRYCRLGCPFGTEGFCTRSTPSYRWLIPIWRWFQRWLEWGRLVCWRWFVLAKFPTSWERFPGAGRRPEARIWYAFSCYYYSADKSKIIWKAGKSYHDKIISEYL